MAITNKRRIPSCSKKCILWLIVIVQLFFIFCFWIFQYGSQKHATGKGVPLVPIFYVGNRVKFVTNTKNAANSYSTSPTSEYSSSENVNQFTEDYIELSAYGLVNTTGIEAEMLIEQPDTIWCFREGTVNETTMLYWNIDTQRAQCKCRKYWHGKDCGQPEVMWRALMLPGKQFKLNEPHKNMKPHRLVYMLEGYFHSLDLLELQIKCVESVVDHYLIYWINNNNDRLMLKALKRRLNEILKRQNFVLYYCSQAKDKRKCNTIEAFKYFKKELKLQSENLFLYSKENIIYAREPLKFFKYYTLKDMLNNVLWQFRLKYNVYGFFWQHPERTHISGFICSFEYLENSKFKLEELFFMPDHAHNSKGNNNVIGDLNHYGGWFCHYCQHPDDIIRYLHENEESSLHNKIELPKNIKNRRIDTKYLEYLIANGIEIGKEKIQLEKIRQYNDIYFAPLYAEKCKSKYGNILSNFFETIEDDYSMEEALLGD